MPSDEQIMSLDIQEDDFLYRVRKGKRIVYVSVLSGDIIPPDDRNENFSILRHLRKVPRWGENWATLTVRKHTHGIESTPDEFRPHGLDLSKLNISSAKFYNFSDLPTIDRFSDRIFRVRCNNETCILKIAKFAHEIRYLQQEVLIYSILASSGFPLAPKFFGYVHEDIKDRTIGFLIEEIPGFHPDIRNLKECTETVRLLHIFGIIHGDLNRYNFVITESGAKLIDFEASTAHDIVDPAAAQEEIASIEVNLKDESGVGRRIPF